VTLSVRRVGPASAPVVLDIIREAFGSRPPLHPPADALSDTEASIATRLALNGGLLAKLDGEPVGTLLFDPVGDSTYLRRVGILPAAQGHGIAGAMIDSAVDAWTGRATRLSVVAREELPRTIAFWVRRGFTQTDRRSPYVELGLRLPKVHRVATPEEMRELGGRIADELLPGDVLVLTGDLGAGKTTFTQGLGARLEVEGPVTSPTFVIAREHAPRSAHRPGLVHVDAYRLGSIEELDDLDLDTSLDDVVTVVEWGEGVAEGLSPSRLEVRIRHADAAAEPGADGEELDVAEPRVVEVQGIGPRWATHPNRPTRGPARR
jgi:tRNA threonylcarbamoyladenosine biosynthesis protein TsaE